MAGTPPPISLILRPGWDSGWTSQQTPACPETALREGLLHTHPPLKTVLLAVCAHVTLLWKW